MKAMNRDDNPFHALRKTTRWLRSPMAATMTALDFQVRGSADRGLVPGGRSDTDLQALADWIEEHYGRRPTGTTFDLMGREIASWYLAELHQTRPVVVTSGAWAALNRLTPASSYRFGVGNQWEPAIPKEPCFATSGVTVLLDGGPPIASSFQDITPGAVPEHLAAITAVTNGDSWSVTEWCDADAALGSINVDGFAAMAAAAEQMAPWSLGGSYLTAASGTAVQFAANRIKSAVVSLFDSPPAGSLSPVAFLSILADAVTMGLLEVHDDVTHLTIGPPAQASPLPPSSSSSL